FIKPLRERILDSEFDEKTKAIIYDKYLTMLGSSSDDATKYMTWIDTVLSLPHHPKKIDINETVPRNEGINMLISKMVKKLNEKVYGMEIAKEEFICMVANIIANPNSKHKAIGLYGPPGVGKTLIAQIIAEVMG